MEDFFKDHYGNYSSKRLITFLFALNIIVGFLINLLTHLAPLQYMFDALVQLTMLGMGLTGAEKVTDIFQAKAEPPQQNSST